MSRMRCCQLFPRSATSSSGMAMPALSLSKTRPAGQFPIVLATVAIADVTFNGSCRPRSGKARWPLDSIRATWRDGFLIGACSSAPPMGSRVS